MAPRKAAAAKKPAGRKTGKPPGLPSALLRLVPGEQRTVHDVLVSDLRLGADVVVAAARAGVTKQSVYEWLRDGSRLVAATEAEPDRQLDAKEAALLRFATEAVEAVAFAEAAALGNVVRIARGARKVTRTYKGAGAEALEVGRVEVDLPPDLAANVFVLERRFPERWTRRQQLEVQMGTGDVDAAPPSPLPNLLAALEAMEARRAEVTAELVAPRPVPPVNGTAADG